MFNDTSRYLDDSFTNENPEFEKHIADIYPAELQWNKVNTLKNYFLLMLWVYHTFPFGFSLIWHFFIITLQLFNYMFG